MQELTGTLDQLKGLHEKVFGGPAPSPPMPAAFPFPPGVDPIAHARAEADHLTRLMESVAFAPRPNAWMPPADTFVADEALAVRVEIPGVSREDIQVHVVGRECIVRGERKAPQLAEGMRPMSLERPWGSFERRFVLPAGIRVDGITARCADGVLELNIPLDPTALPKQQSIQIH